MMVKHWRLYPRSLGRRRIGEEGKKASGQSGLLLSLLNTYYKVAVNIGVHLIVLKPQLISSSRRGGRINIEDSCRCCCLFQLRDWPHDHPKIAAGSQDPDRIRTSQICLDIDSSAIGTSMPAPTGMDASADWHGCQHTSHKQTQALHHLPVFSKGCCSQDFA